MVRAGEPVLTKPRYSAFFGTPLDTLLRSGGVKTVVVTGVATNVCVESTARDAHQLDYCVVLPTDCIAAFTAAGMPARCTISAATLAASRPRTTC